MWLIFVLTVIWTAYPAAFGSIASTLCGAAVHRRCRDHLARRRLRPARRHVDARASSARSTRVFAFSSVLTPFALGTAVGGIASRRVPVGNAAGRPVHELAEPDVDTRRRSSRSRLGAYLAAVFLLPTRAGSGTRELERQFRARALGAGVVAGAMAVGRPDRRRTRCAPPLRRPRRTAARWPRADRLGGRRRRHARARLRRGASRPPATGPRWPSPRSSPAGRSRSSPCSCPA